MHWADDYIGIPFRAGGRDRQGIDCWGLVRLVLAERTGLLMPRYDACADVARTISNQAVAFERVDPEKELDVVIMNEPFRDITGQWRRAPVHIGVCAAPGLVLHILRDMQSRIDRIGSLDVSEIRRVR